MGVEVISQSRYEERNPELIAMKGYKCHMSQKSRSTAIIPRNFSSEDVWDTGLSMKMESYAIDKIHWLGNSEIGTFYSFPFCCCTFFLPKAKSERKNAIMGDKKVPGTKGEIAISFQKVMVIAGVATVELPTLNC